MARIINSIKGHKSEVEQLLSLRKNSRWPHALMFLGPSGIGKKKVALGFAQALVCEEVNDACGLCGACLRIEKLQSESLILVQPDYELSKPIIKVEKIREVLNSLSYAAIGMARVVIIDQAQLMNPQASNSLLKTLEEPTDNIYFILIANEAHQFLPTIRSRSQIVRFNSLSIEDLKTIKPGQPEWCYRSSRGQIDKLEQLCTSEGQLRREESIQFLEQFCSDPAFLVDKNWRDSLKDRSWALFNLNCWLQIVRDILVLKTQAQNFVLNTDQMERLKLIQNFSTNKLFNFSQNIVTAEKNINAYADTNLVFENLWIKYARMD